jgi:cell wall-associated NlpC family hydrolase
LLRRTGRSVAAQPPHALPRRTLRMIVKVLSASGAACVAAALLPAVASQAAQPKTVAQAQSQLDDLNNQAEIASEQYNGAQLALTGALQVASAATAAADRAHSEVAAEQSKVGVFAAQAYETGGLRQGLAVVLSSGNPAQTMTRMSMLEQLGTQQSAVLADVRSADLRYQQSVDAAAQATDSAKQLTAKLAQEQGQINAALAQSQQVLAQLTAAQRAQLLAAQQAKAAADEVRAAAALASYRKAQATQAAQAVSRSLARAAAAKAQSVQNAAVIQSLPQSSRGSTVAQRAVAAAMSRLGDRYVFGATGPSRFDCSGLVAWAYRQAGISTAHYTGALWNAYRHVSAGQLQPGDLVFFYRDHHHVGIYIGNGLMINAPHTGDVVRLASVMGHGSYSGAVRVVG